MRVMNKKVDLRALDKKRDLKGVKAVENAGKAFFTSKIANVFIVPFAAFLDGVVLFSIIDQAMTQSARMGIIMTIAVAAFLNLLPLFIAKFAFDLKYKLHTLAKPLLIMTLSMFILLYSSTVFMRVAYSNMISNTDDTSLKLVNTVSSQEMVTNDDVDVEETASKNREEKIKNLSVVILLCLSPLMTSGVSFCIALVGSDPVRNIVNAHKKEALRLENDIDELETALAGMNYDEEAAAMDDQEAYTAALESVGARRNTMKAVSRYMLAKHLAIDSVSGYNTPAEHHSYFYTYQS